MRQFRKRTIALVLASAMTIAGSFASEQYKNTLMGLSFQFDKSGSGAINMTVETKTTYQGNVSPIKKDANTYVLMLPEVMSEASTPNLNDLGGSIENVRINTLPYTNTGKGYTRIVIKTNNVPSMTGNNSIYIASKEQDKITTRKEVEEKYYQEQEKTRTQDYSDDSNLEQENQSRREKYSYKEEYSQSEAEYDNTEQTADNSATKAADVGPGVMLPPFEEETSTYTTEATSDPTETIMLVLGLLLICACTVFFYTRAKNNLTDIAGETLKIDVDDEPEQNKKPKKSDKIKKTINKLDSTYSRTAVPRRNEYTVSEPVQKAEPIEEVNVVDLDALFKETVSSQAQQQISEDEEENLALEEFLSGFSFDEELVEEEISAGYDADFYEDVLKNQKIKFSNDDIQCINKLLNSEIDDSTLKNLEKYLVSNPVKKKKRSKKELLEDFVTTYAISQNITFTRADVNALYKLMSVEIDSDFITNLRTNPERTKEMQKEIENFNSELKSPSKIKTLNVKNMLPDLSEAMKKQAGKKIESEVKKEVVYYSEGYEVDKLVVDLDLPDLAKEINNKSAYASKPSAAYQIVDNTYKVETLKLSSELPDLNDVLKHPEKYKKPEEKPVVVDEKALLDNISDVSFKPFYDGTQEFEVINDDIEVPTVDSVLQEMSQFENIEIAQDEEETSQNVSSEQDDFEALFNNEYIDLDNLDKEEKNEQVAQKPASVPVQKEVKKAETINNKIVEKPIPQKEDFPRIKEESVVGRTAKRERSEISAELLEKIAQKRKQELWWLGKMF